jgi:site-specific DNA recombinase
LQLGPLRQREQALRAELQSIADQTRERTTYLRLAETLSAFLARLRTSADTLDILERQRLVRLLIKEVLVGDDTIVIRHCIPVPSAPPGGSDPPPSIRSDEPGVDRSYLLRSGSERPPLRGTLLRGTEQTILQHAGVQERSDQRQHACVRHAPGQPSHQEVVIDSIEGTYDTLPISRTCPSGSPSFVQNTHSKGDH